jgi:ELWxxDGT repeat protein
VNGQELWRTDGTADGTYLVKDINPELDGAPPLSSVPTLLVNLDGTLLFYANDGVTGSELWRSDGTPEGTMLVEDINPGANGSRSSKNNTLVLGGVAYFGASDGVRGSELWRTDGTTEGTYLLRDIAPGTSSGLAPSVLDNFVSVGGYVYFTSNAAALWRTDGTSAGTKLVTDFFPGGRTIPTPQNLANVNGELWFGASDGRTGGELWRLPADAPPRQGDYDADGDVDGSDFLTWQRALGFVVNPVGAGADGSGNGRVTGNDLIVWADHFGESEPLGETTATVALSPAAIDAALDAPRDDFPSSQGSRWWIDAPTDDFLPVQKRRALRMRG